MAKALSRLALAMETLGISGYDLATDLKIDPSLVSKWRRSRRRLPERSDTLEKIVIYLIQKDVQQGSKKILPMLVSHNNGEPVSNELAADLLAKWLTEPGPSDVNPSSANVFDLDLDKNSYTSTIEVFGGLEGRYNGIKHFFAQIADLPASCKLYVTLQEPEEWIRRSNQFQKTFMNMMKNWIGSGHGMEFIHYVDQNPVELSDLIENWLLIHLQSDVSSWYLPVYNGHVFPIVSFVVPGHAAFASLKCGESADQIHSTLFSDQRSINQFKWMFEFSRSNCRPLIHVYKTGQTDDLLNRFTANWIQMRSKVMNLQSPLPLMTSLPTEQFKDLLAYNGISDSHANAFIGQLSAAAREDVVPIKHRLVHSLSAIEQAIAEPGFEDPLLGTLIGQKITIRLEDLVNALIALHSRLLKDDNLELGLTRVEEEQFWHWPNMLIVSEAFFASWGKEIGYNKVFSQEATLVSAFDLYYENRWQRIASIHRDKQGNSRKLSELIRRAQKRMQTFCLDNQIPGV